MKNSAFLLFANGVLIFNSHAILGATKPSKGAAKLGVGLSVVAAGQKQRTLIDKERQHLLYRPSFTCNVTQQQSAAQERREFNELFMNKAAAAAMDKLVADIAALQAVHKKVKVYDSQTYYHTSVGVDEYDVQTDACTATFLDELAAENDRLYKLFESNFKKLKDPCQRSWHSVDKKSGAITVETRFVYVQKSAYDLMQSMLQRNCEWANYIVQQTKLCRQLQAEEQELRKGLVLLEKAKLCSVQNKEDKASAPVASSSGSMMSASAK